MISILIPYRADGGCRDRIFDWIVLRWQSLFPDAELCVADSEGEFSRAEARNQAFADSHGDTLVVADADTVIAPTLLKAAIRRLDDHPWVLPYTTYYNLTASWTNQLLGLMPEVELTTPTEWEHALDDSVAGVLVLPRKAFETVGGYDSRFRGWGGEDRAFAYALDVFWGGHVRLPGEVQHLWHPRGADFSGEEWPMNARLLRLYQDSRSIQAMRKTSAR